MKRSILFLAVLFMAAFFVACNHYPHSQKVFPKIAANSFSEIPAFSYDLKLKDIPVKIKPQKDGKVWVEYQVKFEVKDFKEGKNKYAKVFYFVQKDTSVKAPCLILLPPTGGPIELIRAYAEDFADKGFTVFAFYRRESFFRPDKPIEFNVNLFRQAVIDVRRSIDYFETREDADTSRIGIMGISLGGIITALATEADPRIKASVTIVSAAYLDEILDTSGYNRIRKLRKGVMKTENVGRDELRAHVAPALKTIDPATYADRIDPARFMMINGRSDNIIKYHVAQKTWETYGRPTMHLTFFGHYGTIGAKGFNVEKTYEHFLKVLKLKENENGLVRPI